VAVKIDTDALIYSIIMREQAGDPVAPPAGYWQLYIKAGGLYIIDDAGNVAGPFVDGSTSVGWELIAETILGAPGAVTFNAIPNTYRKLRVEITGRSAVVAASDTCALRLGNGGVDAGANYTYMVRREGIVAAQSQSTADNEIEGCVIPGANAAANYFGQLVFEIFNYKDAAMWKTILVQGGHTDAAGYRTYFGVGSWKNIAVCDTVYVFGLAANLVAGTIVRLYGAT